MLCMNLALILTFGDCETSWQKTFIQRLTFLTAKASQTFCCVHVCRVLSVTAFILHRFSQLTVFAKSPCFADNFQQTGCMKRNSQ